MGLLEPPPPLAIAAFPAPRGGFGPLTVSSCAAFSPFRRSDWANQAAPVLVAPSTAAAEAVAVAAGDVWDTVLRGAAAAAAAAVAVGGGKNTVSGMVGGMVGINVGSGGAGGSTAAATAAALATKASVTVVLKDGTYVR